MDGIIIAISILLGSAAIVGLILYLSFVFPMRRHRRQLNQTINHTHSRTLSPQEQQTLSRYLALTPRQYNSLHSINNCRNDLWTGRWKLKSDQAYTIEASFYIVEPDPSETPLFYHRFGKIKAMRFNIPPIWEHAEKSPHLIEFVLTDKLPVVIRIDGVSLDQGMQVIDEYLESKETISTFQYDMDEQPPHTDHASYTADISEEKAPHPTDNTHGHKDPSDDLYGLHHEQKAKGFIVTHTRQLSREEALTVYGFKYHIILALITLAALVAIVWCGTLETADGEPLSVMATLVCGVTLVAWKTLPRWIARPTAKTLQGPLAARIINPSYPNYKALGIGELIFETNTRNKGLAAVETHDIQNQIGHSIEVELTPERYILAYQGRSYIKYYHRPNVMKYLFSGACAALLLSLIAGRLLSASLDIPTLWKGPRYVTLSTLEEAQRYQPANGDILTLSQLPVLCGINEDSEPECNQIMPGQPSAVDLTMDKQRLALINSVRQEIDWIRKNSTIAYMSRDYSVWQYSSPKTDKLVALLNKVCAEDKACASLTTTLSTRQEAPYYGYKDRIILPKEEYDALQKDIRQLLRSLERQAAYRPLEAFTAQRAHVPWQINSFPVGHRNDGLHIYQGGLTLLKTQRAFETPSSTGDTQWDEVMARFATQQSGTLTLTGRVEALEKTSPPTFALNLFHYVPPIWPICLALLAWLTLLGFTVYSGVVCRRRFYSKRLV